MRVGVISFPGATDDQDALRALGLAGRAAEIVRQDTKSDLMDFDALVIAGGKSYGEYLRPGALAQTSQLMTKIKHFAEAGKSILGVGDGFHILLEAGLLPGALRMNNSAKFVRSDVTVQVANNESAFTGSFSENEEIVLPLRTAYGSYEASEEALAELQAKNNIVLRFVAPDARVTNSQIAGIKNDAGNIVGILPQPEFAVEAGFGPDTPERMRSGVDGLRFF